MLSEAIMILSTSLCFIHDYSVSVHYKQNTKPAKKIQKRFPFNFCCASCLNARQLPQDSLVNCQYVFFFLRYCKIAQLSGSLFLRYCKIVYLSCSPFLRYCKIAQPSCSLFCATARQVSGRFLLCYCKIAQPSCSPFALLQDSLAKLQPFCATARQLS